MTALLIGSLPVTKTENEAKASGFQFGASFQALSLCQGALLGYNSRKVCWYFTSTFLPV